MGDERRQASLPELVHGRGQRHADLADRTREADTPHSPVVRFAPINPLRLDSGVDPARWRSPTQTYGALNAAKSNAVLVCHALTMDQHAAGDPSAHRQARLVGRADRARPCRSTPTASS